MTVAPRAVIVTRPTEYELMIRRHGTRQQVGFFLEERGRDLSELDRNQQLQRDALGAVAGLIPLDWRRAEVDRADLGRWLFGPEDVIIAVGQDGLVANVAKYLCGQPVVGVDPEPGRNPGVPVRRRAEAVGGLLGALVDGDGGAALEHRAMVELIVDDGRRLRALNEVFIGHPSHQSARYTVARGDRAERQSSSGLVVVTVESDTLVAFGDGVESDRVELTWGQSARVGVAPESLRLVV